jgi:hypothetical protein
MHDDALSVICTQVDIFFSSTDLKYPPTFWLKKALFFTNKMFVFSRSDWHYWHGVTFHSPFKTLSWRQHSPFGKQSDPAINRINLFIRH